MTLVRRDGRVRNDPDNLTPLAKRMLGALRAAAACEPEREVSVAELQRSYVIWPTQIADELERAGHIIGRRHDQRSGALLGVMLLVDAGDQLHLEGGASDGR
jgi:hypothetical protein